MATLATKAVVGSNPSGQRLRIGSRNSALALVQANQVAELLLQKHTDLTFDISTISVLGDSDKVTPFLQLARSSKGTAEVKSLWTEEMEAMLVEGTLDILVHSLKDVPTQLQEGCVLGGIMERADPRDAFLVKPGLPYKSLGDLPHGSVVGTSSRRRKAMIKSRWPHLEVLECRGNIDTRIGKLDNPDLPFTAIILAAAGLARMNWEHRITAYLSPEDFPYAVGQGALGVESRDGDANISALLSSVENKESRWTCLAERNLLRELRGGCSTPLGVWSEKEASTNSGHDIQLRLGCLILSPDGTSQVRHSVLLPVASDDDALRLGKELAEGLLERGADKILADIRQSEDSKDISIAKPIEKLEDAGITITS